ncbi:alanine/glycine:cation symporter family protein [Pseudobacillus wudalianchiensis]|uniref:Sodium:alanine symporter n=1 Tax=Pseudobacillus wudalianchiensis TaxID=1743143 RepID=A0A1B9B7H9_9BACI|nr:alanine/glycine:cation symporter family protein [Bacillus wudalianchiensis]OCA92019.1 sodium:alanine symporter [Bacillus wudalianchiensis]
MESAISWMNAIVWSKALVFLFLGVGIFFSIATRFVQLRYLKDMFKLTFQRQRSEVGVSSFQALSMSIGSRVGTGNIAGVAVAIALGGPGAVFWMWLMALFSSATAFIETTLTQVYKRKVGTDYRGGPPYYFEKGLKSKKFANIFAIMLIVILGLLYPGIQSNTIAISMENAFGITPAISGLFVTLCLGAIVLGGVKRIAKTAEIIVPFMAIGYLIVCAIILVLNTSQLPAVISLIVSSALGIHATFGGAIGTAIAMGVQRGAYSNGAGTGTETFESGAAEVSHPAKQGLVQSLSVYIDTLVVCSATAFMILLTGMYDVKVTDGPDTANNMSAIEPSLYTQYAVESQISNFGAPFLAIAILFFCFTCIVAFYYKAETSLIYLNSKRKMAWPRYALILTFLVITYFGSVKTSSLGWAMGDLGIGSLAWVHLIALLFLTKPALKVLKDYELQKKQGIDPVFNPVKAGIEGAEFWEEYSKEHKDSSDNQKKKTIS